MPVNSMRLYLQLEGMTAVVFAYTGEMITPVQMNKGKMPNTTKSVTFTNGSFPQIGITRFPLMLQEKKTISQNKSIFLLE